MTPDAGFELRVGTDVEALADDLAVALARAQADPFVPELVVTPSQGMQRWLAQRLAATLGASTLGGDGVCAGISFLTVAGLERHLAGLVDHDASGEDAWQGAALLWAIVQALEASVGEPWFAPVAAHLAGWGEDRPVRRYALARRLATLFRGYALWRPGMLATWREGRDVLPDGSPLDDERLWQAGLWRRVRGILGDPDPAQAREALVRRLTTADPRLLPTRVSVFSPSPLPQGRLAILEALASRVPVTAWHPTVSAASPTRLARRLAAVEPVTLGQYGRLGGRRMTVPATPRPRTLLGQLQDDLAAGEEPRPSALAGADGSIEFHASHGPSRQVAVLRDRLVHLLEQDPSLEPRDVVVACVDIATYAPVLHAAFGLEGEGDAALHPGHRIRVRIADSALREINPLLDVVARLLSLASGRATAGDLLEFCGTGPVRRRFRLTAEELARLEDLVRESGIRWGIDASTRGTFGMDRFRQNTWVAGLQRMQLGVALDERDLATVGVVLPLADVESSEVDLVGRFSELIARLWTVVKGFEQAAPPSDWADRLREAVDVLTDTLPGDAWQVTHASAQLGALVDGTDANTPAVTLAEMSTLLQERLQGLDPRSALLTGALTITGPSALQGVPHRVVCLLGLDEDTFPRRGHVDGDDLVALQPQPGDPDVRAGDRQVLIDALRCARDRFVVIYRARDQRTNEAVPAPVPLREVMDAVDGYTPDGQVPLSVQCTHEHPLQPHSPAAFSGNLPSFDAVSLAGARATLRGRSPAQLRFDPTPLSPVTISEVSLESLAAFFANPVKALLQERGGLAAERGPDEEPALPTTAHEFPLVTNALAEWAIGDRLLRHTLRGHSLADAIGAELRRGHVPPDQLGVRQVEGIAEKVNEILMSSSDARREPRADRDIAVTLAGVRVEGRVRTHGSKVLRVQYSSAHARYVIPEWVTLLALQVAEPGTAWRSVVVGTNDTAVNGPVSPERAAWQLTYLIETYLDGLTRPLPVPPRTAMSYARQRARTGKPVPGYKLQKTWEYERKEAGWSDYFGLRVGALRAAAAGPRERAVAPEEEELFGALAMGIYGPLIGRWPHAAP